ncbi:MAG: neutral/alkaline non-lysosomal ceramidase N-terminal domain-containing protein [Planctomycetaceae bacterium]
MASDAMGEVYSVGAASIDITPQGPVRLAGYAVRKTESEGVEDPLSAKAIAIGDDTAQPAILMTVDSCILSQAIRDAIAGKIEAAHDVPRDQVTINVSHSHTTPMLRGTIPNMFGEEIPAEHAKRIDRYTDRFIERCVEVAGTALANREECRVSWGQGAVAFATNRRTNGGPTDHSVPVLAVHRADGSLKAVVANYACHCTTLGGDFNRVSPDWAGYAALALEAGHPDCVALVTIGCGADQNPAPRTGIDFARRHGLALADEVRRVLARPLVPVAGKLRTRYRQVKLDLAEPPAADHWKTLTGQQDAVGRHARLQLARLDRGEPLADRVDLPVQSWVWGDKLAMVFLGGEVVVDYALRLREVCDGDRLWISGYSNAVPCYIPSERILREGRYEGGGAMIYYDLPGPFEPGLEEVLVDEVKRQLGPAFCAQADETAHGDLAAVAAAILDDAVPAAQREELIAKHTNDSAALLARLVADLEPKSAEERRRIPWIWRVTVAAGKRNDLAELAAILNVALPNADEPLREWQAVVIGGGVINGIGLASDWPAERVKLLLEQNPDLRSRWETALTQAAEMADDESVGSGTRYDALRMVALDDWQTARPILTRYLADKNRELQQGAVSGLSDVRNDEAVRLLLQSLDTLNNSNRNFALDALVRDVDRMQLALDAVKRGRLTAEMLGEARMKKIHEATRP